MYGNVGEIVREALRKQYQNDILQKNIKQAKLTQAIDIGLDQANNGQFSSDTIESLLAKSEN